MKQVIEELKKMVEEGLETAIIHSEEVSKKNYLHLYSMLSSYNPDDTTKTDKRIKHTRPYQKIDDLIKEQIQIVAYYFSNYEHHEIYPNMTQNSALKNAANKLGIKLTHLKFNRDHYDSMNDNHRIGLYPGSPEKFISTKNQLDKKTKEEVTELVKNILLA